MKRTFLILVLFYSSLCNSQVIQWQKSFGGSANDEVHACEQTRDGGFIIGGNSVSGVSGNKTEMCRGAFDYWMIKTDSLGNLLWQKTIGGNDYERLNSIAQTSDGGYILAGQSYSHISGEKTENSYGLQDYWVVKTDSLGNIEWQNSIGGFEEEYLNVIQQTGDKGYIIAGHSASGISGDKTELSNGTYDYWVVKLDSTGTISWQNGIGGNGDDDLRTIDQTDDGGYILGGSSSSMISGDKTEGLIGGNDYWIVKLDPLGSVVWQNTIGGTLYEVCTSIQQTSDGGYICGGLSSSDISGDKSENSRGQWDYWIVKLNSIGQIEWDKTIGGTADDWLYSIRQTGNGGFICGGHSNSGISGEKSENCRGLWDYWIVQLDSTGNIVWQKTIGGNLDEDLFAVRQTNDGGLILGGWSASGVSGEKNTVSFGANDYWLIKMGSAITGIGDFTTGNINLLLYPNPANDIIHISLSSATEEVKEFTVSSLTGQKILQIKNSDHLNVTGLHDGIYMVKTVTTNNRLLFSKLVIQQ